MAEVTIRITDQECDCCEKKNLSISMDFSPDTDVNNPTPAQILAFKFLAFIRDQEKEQKKRKATS
ncbi:MAG: hypothetical protein ABFD76_05030 [Smithella sp.]